MKSKTMKKKVWYLVFIFLAALLFCGCWDKKEFTEVSFATAMAIDKDEKEYAINVLLMLPKDEKQGGEEAPTWLVEGRGASIYEAIEDLNNRSPREVHWGHMQLVILGEGTLNDVDTSLDYFFRSSQFRRNDYVIAVKGSGAQMQEISKEQSKVNTFYIYTLLKDFEGRYKNSAVTLNDCFVWDNYQGEGAYLLPCVSLARASELTKADEEIPQLEGGALIQNSRLVEWIDEEYMEGYRFITDEIQGGAFEIKNPLGDGDITFSIKNSKADFSWHNEVLTIKIKGDVNLAEILGAQGPVGKKEYDKKVIEEKINEYVQKEAEKCLNYSIEKNIDFLHIGQWLDSYHHKDFMNYDGENYLAKLNIKVEGDFKLKLTDIYE